MSGAWEVYVSRNWVSSSFFPLSTSLTNISLPYSDTPLLCIAHELTCDNIEHCPSGSDMRNDEEPAMCFERIGQPPGGPGGMNLWQELSINWLKNILSGNGDPDTGHPNVVMPMYTTTERTGSPNPRQKSTLTRGLARYGPWGYLMLGMLVCGAALLICGLWGKNDSSLFVCFTLIPYCNPL